MSVVKRVYTIVIQNAGSLFCQVSIYDNWFIRLNLSQLTHSREGRCLGLGGICRFCLLLFFDSILLGGLESMPDFRLYSWDIVYRGLVGSLFNIIIFYLCDDNSCIVQLPAKIIVTNLPCTLAKG